MSALTSDLSMRTLKYLLILFVLFTGTVCLYNVWCGFFSPDSVSQKIFVLSKTAYKNQNPISQKTVQNMPVLSKKELENITSFMLYIDSLKQSPEGKGIYESINYSRPGLLDSLYYVENYYKNKSKN
ncbi:hypothetical protein [Flavobacterium aquidurense]|uniref:hypothetical protein n=1 Tax=Flavobacterium aquidurense TaxID=362413 RepID=UPI0028623E4D|nr:hypothetical protein [Flavobacterium aquidurense]MDR7371044.1 hypothetical protein [Flavobacterium aquidurense]